MEGNLDVVLSLPIPKAWLNITFMKIVIDAKENSYATEARAKKVSAMVAVIDRAATKRGLEPFEDASRILESLEKYTDESWAVVDKVARLKHVSSKETRGKVKDKYRERAENAPF